MKLIKLTVLATLAALAASLGTEARAQQIVGTTTMYSTLNISATVITNANGIVGSGLTRKSLVGRAKFGNKELLNLFAQWSGQPNGKWPAGAKLEYDWQNSQVVVADKTGTNVLFYAGDGVRNDTVTAWLNIDWFNNGAESWDNTVGQYTDVFYSNGWYKSETGTEYYTGRIELYYQDSTTSTDLYASGMNNSGYSQTYSSTTGYCTSWSDSEKVTASGAGADGTSLVFQDGPAAITVTFTASGKGKF